MQCLKHYIILFSFFKWLRFLCHIFCRWILDQPEWILMLAHSLHLKQHIATKWPADWNTPVVKSLEGCEKSETDQFASSWWKLHPNDGKESGNCVSTCQNHVRGNLKTNKGRTMTLIECIALNCIPPLFMAFDWMAIQPTCHGECIVNSTSFSPQCNLQLWPNTLILCWDTLAPFHFYCTMRVVGSKVQKVHTWCLKETMYVHKRATRDSLYFASTLLHTLVYFAGYIAGTVLVLCWLHCCYFAGYIAVTLLVTLLLLCWYFAVTFLVLCWYCAVTLLVHCWYITAHIGAGCTVAGGL